MPRFGNTSKQKEQRVIRLASLTLRSKMATRFVACDPDSRMVAFPRKRILSGRRLLWIGLFSEWFVIEKKKLMYGFDIKKYKLDEILTMAIVN